MKLKRGIRIRGTKPLKSVLFPGLGFFLIERDRTLFSVFFSFFDWRIIALQCVLLSAVQQSESALSVSISFPLEPHAHHSVFKSQASRVTNLTLSLADVGLS